MDIVKYLRSNQEGWHDPDIVWVQVSAARVKEAADEIERLREENNKLKLEFVSAVDKAEKYSRSAFSRNERNKELRSALTAILAVSQRYDKPTMNVITDCARAALKGDE